LKLPIRNRHWAREAVSEFDKAERKFERGETDIDSIYDLFQLAPEMVFKNRKLKNRIVLEEMRRDTLTNALHDFKADPETVKHFCFHFVIAYIHCHVTCGILSEREADKIMLYISANINLFGREV